LILVKSAPGGSCEAGAKKGRLTLLRVLALLCSLALLLAPLGAARAEPGCALLAAAQDMAHAAHGSDHEMPPSGHVGQGCKQLCAVVAIPTSTDPVMVQSVGAAPSPRPAAGLPNSRLPDPSERPPKQLI
jgi:hypothetical protein